MKGMMLMLFNLFKNKKKEVVKEVNVEDETLSKLKQFAKEFEIVAERYNKMVEENVNE